MSTPVPVSASYPHLIIFARRPRLGQVKTRLAADIGPAAALAVYQQLLAHTREMIAPLLVHKTVWLTGAALAPEAADEWADYEQLPQPEGDLGEKMQAAFAHDFARAAGAVVIIGTDCPGLTTAHLQAAFEALSTHDVVLGPATDGGYYLLGMKQLRPSLFQNKAWSTATVLEATVADAQQLGLRLHLLPALSDIDTGADLRDWEAAAGKTFQLGLRVQ
ncbi:TIGR04282 family arsenosugar biosynthesis glycosyltransferase [Hymenobacter sp. HSC-4F20]|uniref:TIGR04282 family arsenosugar biosynthesis glycosyltransferase n=1 Tax=Hymenobacter sp. HSC-4F20 TaxID=2864135 RepID=UPI001C73DFB7|nr:TIGR04282 family arsenosugar biosynthesis glycosyltransferase [Hymenobacter sp. HSC-4F20]MBX0289996.1 TIGR04282 family arsenosugar biosynthesis glycosyltransferase [Hymenobacter sp. HSC-4F20]